MTAPRTPPWTRVRVVASPGTALGVVSTADGTLVLTVKPGGAHEWPHGVEPHAGTVNVLGETAESYEVEISPPPAGGDDPAPPLPPPPEPCEYDCPCECCCQAGPPGQLTLTIEDVHPEGCDCDCCSDLQGDDDPGDALDLALDPDDEDEGPCPCGCEDDDFDDDEFDGFDEDDEDGPVTFQELVDLGYFAGLDELDDYEGPDAYGEEQVGDYVGPPAVPPLPPGFDPQRN